MEYNNVCLDTLAYELAPRVISSEEIEKRLAPLYQRLGLRTGRLELMSGIQTRRLWKPGTRPSQAATMAGEKALVQSDIDPKEINCLIFCSVSKDMLEPATAAFVHRNLGLSSSALLFDVSNACLGFLDGMILLANMIELGQVDNGLIVSGETAEELLESTLALLVSDTSLTRKTIKPAFASLTIGSGAIAAYIRKTEPVEKGIRLVHGTWQANTQHNDLCRGGQEYKSTLMTTDSEELLHRGVETALATWRRFSEKKGWTADEIDNFFCHQVGSAHAKLLFETLGLPPEKNYETLRHLGNVGSVSAPITMAMAIEHGVFIPGNKGALLGIGSGINTMMLGVEW
ncbi:MAG: 3-oxoacyl-ACP synthase III [Deltaproteobacteria bacterium]|nr:MAG: 3-oxoacyl-ACP synthase III [Desulfobacterales bacterium]PIE72215.1 MAG: 3-oxoacyl-ACP synthase III [Deltaproteobacteria bacterium]